QMALLFSMKTTKTYIFFLLLVLPLLVSSQQTYFSKIYNPFGTFGAAVHVIELDSVYIIGGIAKDSITNYQTLIILKIDKTGNLISVLKPGKDSIKYYPGVQGSLCKLPDNSFIWSGQVNNGIKGYGFLIKLDSSLNKVWEREYMLNNDTVYSYLGILQAKQTDDNGFILVGDIDASGQYNTDILLIKTDSLGNKKWQKTYNYIGYDRGWNIIQTPDSGFLIGAGGYIAGNTQSYDGLIIKTDSLGNEKWRKVIGDIYKDYYCVVKNSNDGNFIIGTATGVGQMYPEVPYRRIRLLKINNSGSVIWDKMYGKTETGYGFNNIIVLINGDIAATGFYDPDSLDIGDSWSWILKTNTNGDSLWMREYYRFNGHANVNRFYDIKQTQDGGFITCGQVDSTNVPQHIWVMKLDSFGCDTPGCHTVGINELVISNHELVIYPNPASDEIIFDFYDFEQGQAIDIVIYNAVGVEVKKEHIITNNQTKTINIKDLKSGIYYYQIIPTKSIGKPYSGKFVKM
ncbi:MAG: T9SS type A sorting domain-containing protein, partial [Saprospiraceae bacterium]|nr:T9SS type A sorting domain-containing protein [Saprospiraceae bacterium]